MFSFLDDNEQKNMIFSIGKELEMLNLQADQISKKNILREKQLDDAKKHNVQEEQGTENQLRQITYCTQIISL